jgi:hypothetical protein
MTLLYNCTEMNNFLPGPGPIFRLSSSNLLDVDLKLDRAGVGFFYANQRTNKMIFGK